jgi:hypothetical protein
MTTPTTHPSHSETEQPSAADFNLLSPEVRENPYPDGRKTEHLQRCSQ